MGRTPARGRGFPERVGEIGNRGRGICVLTPTRAPLTRAESGVHVLMGAIEPPGLRRDICIIQNRKSGRGRAGETTRALRDALAGQGADVALRSPRRGRDILNTATQAVREGFGTIIAVGGDGTQSAVAQAVAGSDAVMGVVPTGTFNYFARSIGVGCDIDRAIATIRAGHSRAVAVGDLNGRTFLNNVSLGTYPQILQEREAIYKRWGRSRIAAYWSVLRVLAGRRRPFDMQVSADGVRREFRAPLAFVGLNAYQLRSFALEGAQAAADDRLALFVSRADGAADMVAAALRLARQTAERGRDFDLLCADALTIDTGPRARLVAFDGEKTRMTGPFHLRVRPDALRVFVPARGAA
ncbi:diacylglycerol/lipid kinase family protein [Actibacterium ureilyticum]|uniref:diacylglycerol/lipid kinase family protein n=1 Tax=Actibacterium ureilyticum TaxID=1590614 RepID=UPI000BAB1248|nr:diacylglycerol kinase family protein [Actibacterium ureilyticum]